MAHISSSEFGAAPSHYLTKFWLKVIGNPRNNIHLNFHQKYEFKKMHLKMELVKCPPFWLGFNGLKNAGSSWDVYSHFVKLLTAIRLTMCAGALPTITEVSQYSHMISQMQQSHFHDAVQDWFSVEFVLSAGHTRMEHDIWWRKNILLLSKTLSVQIDCWPRVGNMMCFGRK